MIPGFYGWRIVAVAFIADFFAVGFLFYSYGVFFKAIALDLGGARFGVSVGLTASFLAGSLFAPFLGRALDGRSIRLCMGAGAVMVAMGYALVSQVRTIYEFYAVFALFVGIGATAMGGLSSATLVSNWFVTRRGIALGVATIGISFSGFLMPTVATALIASLGWRGGYLVYAAATLVFVLPPVLLVVRNRPEEIGLLPDGDAAGDAAPVRPSQERIWTTRELLRDPRLWLISTAFGLAFFGTSGVLVHLVPYATDLGIAEYPAAWCLSIAAGFGTGAKFLFGYLVDRTSARLALALSFGAQLAGLGLIARASDATTLYLAAAVFGSGMGGMVPLQGTLTGRVFGRLSYGKAAGLMRPVQTPLHILGPPLAGWVFDKNGNYELAFAIFAAAYVLAIAFGVALGRSASR